MRDGKSWAIVRMMTSCCSRISCISESRLNVSTCDVWLIPSAAGCKNYYQESLLAPTKSIGSLERFTCGVTGGGVGDEGGGGPKMKRSCAIDRYLEQTLSNGWWWDETDAALLLFSSGILLTFLANTRTHRKLPSWLSNAFVSLTREMNKTFSSSCICFVRLLTHAWWFKYRAVAATRDERTHDLFFFFLMPLWRWSRVGRRKRSQMQADTSRSHSSDSMAINRVSLRIEKNASPITERTPTASYLAYRHPHHKDLALSVSTTKREWQTDRQMDHDATTPDSAVMVFSTRFIERAIERALGLSIPGLKDSSRYLWFCVFRCALRRFEWQRF